MSKLNPDYKLWICPYCIYSCTEGEYNKPVLHYLFKDKVLNIPNSMFDSAKEENRFLEIYDLETLLMLLLLNPNHEKLSPIDMDEFFSSIQNPSD